VAVVILLCVTDLVLIVAAFWLGVVATIIAATRSGVNPKQEE